MANKLVHMVCVVNGTVLSRALLKKTTSLHFNPICCDAGFDACTCVGARVCDKSVDDKNSLVNLFLSVRYALYGVSLRE